MHSSKEMTRVSSDSSRFKRGAAQSHPMRGNAGRHTQQQQSVPGLAETAAGFHNQRLNQVLYNSTTDRKTALLSRSQVAMHTTHVRVKTQLQALHKRLKRHHSGDLRLPKLTSRYTSQWPFCQPHSAAICITLFKTQTT
jgi:hypothetical protein